MLSHFLNAKVLHYVIMFMIIFHIQNFRPFQIDFFNQFVWFSSEFQLISIRKYVPLRAPDNLATAAIVDEFNRMLRIELIFSGLVNRDWRKISWQNTLKLWSWFGMNSGKEDATPSSEMKDSGQWSLLIQYLFHEFVWINLEKHLFNYRSSGNEMNELMQSSSWPKNRNPLGNFNNKTRRTTNSFRLLSQNINFKSWLLLIT